VVRAFLRVWLPLLISAVVTAIGFGSLGVSRITAIRDLGLFAVVGIACLTCTSLGFLPAALELLGTEPRSARSGKISPRLTAALTRLGRHAYASRAKILAGAAVLSLAGFVGALAIRVDSDFLYYFDPKAEVRTDAETINREIVGSNPFY